jgi:hypothetical protein
MFSPNPARAPSTAGSGYTRARTPQGGMIPMALSAMFPTATTTEGLTATELASQKKHERKHSTRAQKHSLHSSGPRKKALSRRAKMPNLVPNLTGLNRGIELNRTAHPNMETKTPYSRATGLHQRRRDGTPSAHVELDQLAGPRPRGSS